MVTKNNIIISGVFFRFLVYCILIFFPFYHYSFGFVSPFTYQEFADLSFYKNFGEAKFNISNFIKNYLAILSECTCSYLEKIDNHSYDHKVNLDHTVVKADLNHNSYIELK